MTRIIYHLLCCTLGEGVSVAKVVDFDVLDIIAILLVDLAVDVGHCGFGLWTCCA